MAVGHVLFHALGEIGPIAARGRFVPRSSGKFGADLRHLAEAELSGPHPGGDGDVCVVRSSRPAAHRRLPAVLGHWLPAAPRAAAAERAALAPCRRPVPLAVALPALS